MLNQRTKTIYKAILANGKMLVDFRDLNDVLNRMIKDSVSFKVDGTESIGIYSVTATKVPVDMLSTLRA